MELAIDGYRFAKSSNDKEKTKMSSKTVKCSAPTWKTGKSAPVPSGNRGFTLIELLLTVTIVSVLALIALPAYSKIRDKAKEVRCSTELREFERVIDAYAIDHSGVFPAGWDILGMAPPLDPWGNPYVISIPVRRAFTNLINKDTFDLYSKGPDGRSDPDTDVDKPDSLDDIVRAGGGGYVGTVRNMPGI
jgi:prepilin-type N-terminal cleavage/methylation domain-containing protein